MAAVARQKDQCGEWGAGRAEPPLIEGAVASQLKLITATGAVAPEWTDSQFSKRSWKPGFIMKPFHFQCWELTEQFKTVCWPNNPVGQSQSVDL